MSVLQYPTARPGPINGREIVLHIGRNKAGSTTLQDFCQAAKTELRVQGVDYVLFGHLADSDPTSPGFPTFPDLAAEMRASPGQRRLISNEFMFAWPEDFTEAAARALAGFEVQILAYIRPYDAWVVSAYAEETRRGMNMRDIDAYLEHLRPRISAWPALRKWAECFGWERLRLRDLSRPSLFGGELVADFVHALGLTQIPLRQTASNVAPHWIELELTRRLAERNGDSEWAGVARAEIEPLLAELRPLLGRAPAATYLTLEQRRGLRRLYNDDLARIEAAGGPRLQPARGQLGEERPFRPSLVHAPGSVLRRLAELAEDAAFAERHPAAAARVRRLEAELERAWPEAGAHRLELARAG